jgi:hypothetical protein
MLLSLFMKTVLACSVDVVNPDGIRYFNSASQLMAGNVLEAFSYEKMLIYTLILGVINFFVNDWTSAGQSVTVSFLVLSIIPLYIITKHWFGTNSALWSILAFIVIPSLNSLASRVVKDAPFLFFMLLALLFGCRALTDRRLYHFFATVSCAVLATLFRFEAIIFLPVYLLWLFSRAIYKPVERSFVCKGIMVYVAVPVVGLITMSGLLISGALDVEMLKLAWLRFSQHYFSSDLLANYRDIYAHLKSVEGNFPGGQWTNDFFEIARYGMPLIYFLGMLQVLAVVLFPVFLIPFFVGVRSLRDWGNNVSLLLWTITAYLGMAYFFIVTRNFLAERYLMIVAVMMLPFVGYGCDQIWQRIRSSRYPSAGMAVVVILFICLPLYKSFAGTFEEKVEIRLAGEWLKESRDVRRQRIIATDERIPFYAGLMRGSYEVFPEGVSSDYETFAIERGCSLVAVDITLRDAGDVPAFVSYKLINEFRGAKKAVLIFEALP